MNEVTDNVERHILKAKQAIQSAQFLFENKDFDGACNRAYYAMYDMVLACLWHLDADLIVGKTHNGTINKFHEQLIKTNLLPIELGKKLKRAESIRYTADYTTEAVEEDVVVILIDDANIFMSKTEQFITS